MTADTMIAVLDVTTVVGGTMTVDTTTVVQGVTTVAGDTMTADTMTVAAGVTNATAVAEAGPWTTGATAKGVRGTALHKMMTLPQPLTLLRQRRRHQTTRSTRHSMMLASTQPSAVATKDLARSEIQPLLKRPHLHHLSRTRCLIYLPHLLLHRSSSSSSSQRNNNRPQPTRLMHSVSHRHQLHHQ